MDNSEIEETFPSIGEPKLHGEMYRCLCAVYMRVLAIFPDIEAARPRSTSGIQALCSLHVALEKTKNVLQHCVECSKLYLAITGDSVVLKFEKARFALEDSLKRVEGIVPEIIGSQIAEILLELGRDEFAIDPVEKEIGDEIIALLQQGSDLDSNGGATENSELESFHQAATKLCITSSGAALRERRALKKLLERARAVDDRRKESIVAYLLHLMKRYSKMFRTDLSDDNDSQGGSTPCSPTTLLRDGWAFDRQLSKLSSFGFKPDHNRVPPEELRCPISLQLMYDPVIISSGQTYERVCIEKWFSDGHNTCPKTQQQLPHLSLTPNYCVKGLVTSWCEQNGVPVPDSPPESLDLDYWRLVLSGTESENVAAAHEDDTAKGGAIIGNDDHAVEETADDDGDREALKILEGEMNLMKKCEMVEQIRHLLKTDEEARIRLGAAGFVAALVRFLESSLNVGNEKAQETAAMALFNLAVNNNRNKELMLQCGVLSVLKKMISSDSDSVSASAVAAVYLNLSYLDEAKPLIGAAEEAVPFLIRILKSEPELQCRLDALHALYNVSSHPGNASRLLSSGVVDALGVLISSSDRSDRRGWTEKCIAVLIHLASSTSRAGRDEIISSPGLVAALSTVLDSGEPAEQEQSAACLLILCNADEKCSQMVLQEGVIPSLVSISVNGTMRGRQKAQKLLMLFREQRQRDPAPVATPVPPPPREKATTGPMDSVREGEDRRKQVSKSVSRKRVGKAIGFWWKNKSFAVYQC
ncbi:hypothetical protein M569_03420 [Genlisea aurea]|uniref:RING-type E3 ubiquitin transferase n=1 Tax=Genlisea aurea TaxID=192259 RepID=S8CVH1_9LAMI|nr:hypothetical protein M569_03420 [Genlisea aurea]